MEEIAISQFKAKCLAILQRVKKTGKPVRVTRFGQVIAEVYPPPGSERVPRLGTGRGTGVILGDIISPASDESDWEAAQDDADLPSQSK